MTPEIGGPRRSSRVRSWSRTRTRRTSLAGTVGVATLALFLLANPFASTSASGTSSTGGVRANTAVAVRPLPTPNLTILLPEFPAEGTTDISLEAAWGAAPSGCSLRPGWSAWFLPSPGAAGGLFTSPDAARTEFVPANLSSATSEVGVRSDTELSCGNLSRTVQGVAYSNVTTYPTLTLSDLSAGPSATAVPGRVHLSGLVAGGRPPYLLGIDWGDGSFSNRTLPAAGEFLVPHTFGSGDFRPRVGVYDSDRIDVRGVVPEPVEASNGTVLAINASLPLAEVGVPVEFQGTVQRPVVHYGAAIACATDPIVLPKYYITNVTCTPTAPGTLGVTFKLGAPAPTLVVQETREEPVAPALALLVRPEDPSLDARTQTYVRVTIVGGVPPFRVTWGSLNGTLGSRWDAPADGSFLVAWTPPFAGVAALNGSVTDSLGASAASAREKLIVNAPPNLTLRANTTIGLSATTLAVQATIAGGSALLFWGLVTDPDPAADTAPLGGITHGSFDWSATFLQEGVAAIDVEVVDAASAVMTGTLAIGLPVAPTLQASDLPGSLTGPPSINLTLTTAGGVLPFSIWVNSSGANLWNCSEVAPGPYLESISLASTGPVGLSVTLVDVRGARTTVNVSLNVPIPPVGGPAPLGGSESDLTPWVGGAALVGLAGGLGLALWRRRVRPPETAPPDAEAVLERLLRPADGADRLTIELMAEEEGVPLETVQETLDRLIREGRVRSETDPGGGEVLAWSAD